MKDAGEGKHYSRREFLKAAAMAGATIAVGGGMGEILAACAGGKTTGTTAGASTSTATSGVTATATSGATTTATTPTTGGLPPIVVPTIPAKLPGYGGVDPATGLHVQGTPQVIDLPSYRLKVDGKVTRTLSLSYDDIRRLPKVTGVLDLNCPGLFTDKATWSGVLFKTIFEMAGVPSDAKEVKMIGADGHYSFLDLKDAVQSECFLAYELWGKTMPVLQGFPLRAALPGHFGSPWVKWLLQLTFD